MQKISLSLVIHYQALEAMNSDHRHLSLLQAPSCQIGSASIQTEHEDHQLKRAQEGSVGCDHPSPKGCELLLPSNAIRHESVGTSPKSTNLCTDDQKFPDESDKPSLYVARNRFHDTQAEIQLVESGKSQQKHVQLRRGL